MKTKLLSGAQRKVLENLEAGKAAGDGFSGRSARGGFGATLRACRVHGLIASYYLTGENPFVTMKGDAALRDGRYKIARKP